MSILKCQGGKIEEEFSSNNCKELFMAFANLNTSHLCSQCIRTSNIKHARGHYY